MTKIIKKFFADFNDITEYYNFLVNKTKNLEYIDITNEVLVDNYAVLVEHKNNIRSNKKKLEKRKKFLTKNYYFFKNIINKRNYNIDFKYLVEELRKNQKELRKNYSYEELSTIFSIIVFVYTERLNALCNEEKEKLSDKEDVEFIIKNKEELSLSLFIPESFDVLNNSHYIFQINKGLRQHKKNNHEIFKKLHEYLQDKNISLKEIINVEYQKRINNNILMSNIFNNLKEILEYSLEELYEKVSKTEQLLLKDSVYQKMTVESKKNYRKRLILLAKRNHANEYNYLKKLLNSDQNINNKLYKKRHYTSNVVIYILILIALTSLTSYFLSEIFIKQRIIGFIILFFPIMQLVGQIMNEIIIHITPANSLPRLDYTEGIPEESRTMVVIPTIIYSKEKVKEMFDKLESFYLTNKTANLYFTLLGDGCASNERLTSYEKEVAKYGEKYAEKLNEKYQTDLFYFLYRRRVWVRKENCYTGYERKRGALQQFNKILLGEQVDEKMHFYINMLKNKKLNIKYVVTLDENTKVVLNSIINLVGTMAHPHNRPILNKNKTKVVSGYGMLQPRISTDLENINKSIYTKVFAGSSGFDIYSVSTPNFYQEFFGEVNFNGKGIYNLKVYNKLLENVFSDNEILSANLLEGNYLRCGYVSDVELTDNYPSNFLVDSTSNYRHARANIQIINRIFSKVINKDNKKISNPLNLLERLKILNNNINLIIKPLLLIIMFLSFFLEKRCTLLWIGLIILEVIISNIFSLRTAEDRKIKGPYKKNHIKITSFLLRSYINFTTIPFYTKMYLEAFIRTIYRMTRSHENLLEWTPTEEIEKNTGVTLKDCLRKFIFNIIISIVFIIIGLITTNYLAYALAVVFLSGPFVIYLISKNISQNKVKIKPEKNKELEAIAIKTWKYFEDNLKEEYNYLIPDNYQEDREEKASLKTSPTNIGFSLISIISANELNFIDELQTIELIEKVLKSIDTLKKWNGHLYNWYNIKTKEVLEPNFISTTDSGNLISCLIITEEFLKAKQEFELSKLCDKLIKNANFKKLYSKESKFSEGFDIEEARLSPNLYTKLESEARLTSYLAICLGAVPSKHWMTLEKTLITYKGKKGLTSQNGTASEYFMPNLFMKNYPNTLLDETYHFVLMCQKEYIKNISQELPWGISESAYVAFDETANYKKKKFSIPYLKAKEDKENKVVIAPYASLQVTDLFPKDVSENIKKFKRLEMYGKYGFYEAYDFDNKDIVKAFFASHLGMSLVGITNYLKSDLIKNLFHNNINIKTFEILLKEKILSKTNIDMKMVKYKKYNYEKEQIENDTRFLDNLPYLPEMSVLSNKNYSLIINDRGNSFSKYRTLQLNRYRKVSELDYGIFLFIKDVGTNYIWSNTYAPMNIKPNKYEVVFATDKINFLRKDSTISTKTEIVVCKNHHAEIRKITFKNEGEENKELELTSYTEPILSENSIDITNKVVNNMFITTEYDSETNSLIARRKNNNISNYMVTRLIIENPLEEYEYETERTNFIGRNRLHDNALCLEKKLTNYAGDNLDPILSLRNKIIVPANSFVTVYLLVGYGRSKEQIDDIINSYADKNSLEKAFQLSMLMNLIDNKNLGITGKEMRTFNTMLNYLYQTNKISVTEDRMNLLRKNVLGQSGLWKFGISGNRPIISVEINDVSDMSFIYEILKAFEYFKNKSIYIDIIIINSEDGKFSKVIKQEIKEELYRIYTLNSFYNIPGSVTIVDSSKITKEDRSLLDIVPHIKFVVENHINLKEAIEKLQRNNKISKYSKKQLEENVKMEPKEKLINNNGYGGFKNNGTEYLVYNKNTPTPWSNVIANKKMGTIITNNGCGYTYAYDSSKFRISSCKNETIINDKSEGFNFDGKVFNPQKCTHGFGYSILESETDYLSHEITEYVALEDPVKIYFMTLKNKKKNKLTTNVEFWINPTLGDYEEKTSRNILSEFVKKDNCLKMRNTYNNDYSDINVFITSSEEITTVELDKMLIKNVNFDLTLASNQEKQIVFILGCSPSDRENLELIRKYSNIETCKKELKKVKDYWNKSLGTIQVKTPDTSFNYALNGWYLYQTMTSRIMAKASFYETNEKIIYRDILQDAINISIVNPEFAKEQIITSAKHQFIEGDVLHWWNEKKYFGLRSRYTDDHLWLVYAVMTYIEITGDYNILKEEIPYTQGERLSDYEQEKEMIYNYSDNKDSLLKHCFKSLDLTMNNLGPHKIPLIGEGDFCDSMNKVGSKGRGESVLLGFFLYSIIDLFTKTIEKYQPTINLKKYQEFNENLKENLNKKTWDNDHYLRAFFDNGDKLGSSESDECKIELLSQSLAILSGVPSNERVQKIITSVEEKLVDEKNKIIKFLSPAFNSSLNNPGKIMDYPKGSCENGGQHTESTSWYLMALIKSGYHDRAYRYYQMLNPINHTKNKKEVRTYKLEPYVIASDIYSANNYLGQGSGSWYTGASSWFYHIGIRYILGIQQHGTTLSINPKIPIAWEGYKAVYKYQDTTYEIEVNKTNKEEIILDGKKKSNNNIPLTNDSKIHHIKVSIK